MTDPTQAPSPRQTTKVIAAVVDAHAKPSALPRWGLGLAFLGWSAYERYRPHATPPSTVDVWVFHVGLLVVGLAVLPGVGELLLEFAKGAVSVFGAFRKAKDGTS